MDQSDLTKIFREVNVNKQTVSSLLDSGFDVNYKDEEGWTPLMYTVRFGSKDSNLEITKYLIERGADVEVVNDNNWTALYICVRYFFCDQNFKTFKYLMNIGASMSTIEINGCNILLACLKQGCRDFDRNQWLEMFNMILTRMSPNDAKTNIDINLQNEEGRTALMYTAMASHDNMEGSDIMMKTLLDKGANKVLKDKIGNTYLNYLNKDDEYKRNWEIFLKKMNDISNDE